ncbi:MAG: EVE domain-containing protein [Clostridia bacterium]|nr:EVE domain-containing protein [Clostridia bacterium]
MKEKILLDTNMMIYLLDDHILDEKISKLTKILYDSDKYTIAIHPNTITEAGKIKDQNRKNIFISKLKVYKIIENPPKAPDDFNQNVGCNNENDLIDNEMLYAVVRNCVSYFITNDKKLLKKADLLGLADRVLSIDAAISKFKQEEKVVIETPVFIKKEFLYNMNLDDNFFSSLRADYKGFDNWFIKKQRKEEKAYVTTTLDNKITSFLMLKEEDENEDYSAFEKPFSPSKRLKVSTFKVADTGKKIGESFIKIMIDEAIEKNINEIYVTTFEKQESLIYLLKQYGFYLYTHKSTTKSDGTVAREAIYVKDLKDKSQFPYVQLKEQDIFIFPVNPKYHKLLFEDAEHQYQISIDDTQGKNTSANAIKKAFISNAKIKKLKAGDIVLFYASQDKKAITTLGIVETTWNEFESQEEIFDIVRKRTAYDEEELQQVTKLDSLVIMFKHYITFKNPITYDFLYNNGIVNGYIQRPLSIEKDDLEKIIVESQTQNMFEIV